MHIEIINTGSELLLGSTLNTHGAWLGNALFKAGFRVNRQTTVPDGPAIREALRESSSRSDVVIVTGGIGPTSDDITREAAADVLARPLITDPVALADIHHFFKKRNRPVAPENDRQALKPDGATMLPNPHGTAPGIFTPPELDSANSCALFLLPGPPSELYPMFTHEVLPRLLDLHPHLQKFHLKELLFTGIGESDFHAKLDTTLENIPNLEIGYCARPGEVTLRLIGNPNSIQRATKEALSAFPHKCFSQSGESLEKVVVQLLSQQQKSLSLAESCTGGNIANRITNISGASAIFTHGFITYSNLAKQQMLGIQSKLIDQFGAVSKETAIAMAEGARIKANSDIAASVTGIAGPTGGSPDKPVGTVWIGISTPSQSFATNAFFPRGRDAFKLLVSQKTLDIIRLTLLEKSPI